MVLSNQCTILSRMNWDYQYLIGCLFCMCFFVGANAGFELPMWGRMCVCVCVMLYQWRMFPQVHQVWHEGLFLRYHVWMRSGSSKKSCQITLEVVKLSTFHKDTARQMVISAGSLLWHFHSTMYIYILITAYSLHGLHAVYILRSALRGNAVRSVCN